MIKCATTVTTPLLELLPRLNHVLQKGDDSLRKALMLLESYVILDAAQTLQAYASQLLPIFTVLIDTLKYNGLNFVCKVHNTYIHAHTYVLT